MRLVVMMVQEPCMYLNCCETDPERKLKKAGKGRVEAPGAESEDSLLCPSSMYKASGLPRGMSNGYTQRLQTPSLKASNLSNS